MVVVEFDCNVGDGIFHHGGRKLGDELRVLGLEVGETMSDSDLAYLNIVKVDSKESSLLESTIIELLDNDHELIKLVSRKYLERVSDQLGLLVSESESSGNIH